MYKSPIFWDLPMSYFLPNKFKYHYVAPQFLIFRRTIQISFIEMRTYFSFGLILRDIPNSITPQNTLRFGCFYSLVPASGVVQAVPPSPPPPIFLSLFASL